MSLGGCGTDPRDDLDGALEQLVLGLGVNAVGVGAAQLGEDRRRLADQPHGLLVDEHELHLDAEAGALRRVELDPHRPDGTDGAGVTQPWRVIRRDR